ncbi:oligopeptide ABC transporter substrate-binding protein [Lapidilactobacillus wuchangensis]|uniref:oligopeptide ABC transporter substrate-binding protein n=1 Tax=Lapidilactobacillus wuchangensis TaxID=2486001 RepID=UPI000F7731ED|nr:oligopeptide ABC transporter substrate-binding protein [Lapidilactobacillus wuchangensis]
MMKWKTGWLGCLAAVCVGTILLAGCQNHDNSAKTTNQYQGATLAKLPIGVHNGQPAIKGGHFKYALVSWSPFKGIFNEAFVTDKNDEVVADPGNEPLFKFDDNYRIIDGGAANLRLNIDAKTVTITINPNVRWSDGQSLVAEDVLYSYLLIANPKSQSQRYTNSLAQIVGMTAYHTGQADHISGIDLPNGAQGNQVVIHYLAMKPGMTQSGNGYFWEYASPSHQLKQIPFDQVLASDQIRKTPLYYGPYQVKHVESGQLVTWVPNPYYYGRKPQLASITFNVVSPNSVAQVMQKHQYDVATVAGDQFTDLQNDAHIKFIGDKSLSYRYLAFKMGRYRDGKNVMNTKSKLQSKALRQAIIYSMDVDGVARKYTNGWQFKINTLIPRAFKQYYNDQAASYDYDPAKAAKLLDQAGYRKSGKWRVQPNGKPLVLHFAVKQDSTHKEEMVQTYLAEWHKLGLNVKLTAGRLLEANSFYDKLMNDDADIDFFEAGWDLSTEPSPADLYSETANFNFGRFVTKKNNQLLAEIDDVSAFDSTKRIEAFRAWQTYMNQAAYVVPTTGSYDVRAVNRRVKGFSLAPTVRWENVSVTSQKR